MILATWLGQAAMEEQTTVLHVIIKVYIHNLCSCFHVLSVFYDMDLNSSYASVGPLSSTPTQSSSSSYVCNITKRK